MDFLAIDVETANADLASICQVGVAEFRNNQYHSSWSSLVNPQDEFDGVNISIHGITESDVVDAPTWLELSDKLNAHMRERVVACHTAFDRLAVTRASARYEVAIQPKHWLDTACVARRAWPKLMKSYGLQSLASHFVITYTPHDAFEDARCAGMILSQAIRATGLAPDQWVDRVRLPIDLESLKPTLRAGNAEGRLFGEIAVFTGALSVPRREAADFAADAGCEVHDGVTKHTTLLVVGDQDIRKLAGEPRAASI